MPEKRLSKYSKPLNSKQMNERFKTVRNELKLSQREFADRLKIQQGSISDIERGRIGVSKKVSDALVHELSVNQGWLFDGEGDIFNYQTKGKNSGGTQGNDGGTVKSLGGENKSIYESYKILERIADENLIERIQRKELPTNYLYNLLLSETENSDDKTLNYYIRSLEDINKERPDLSSIKRLVTDIISGSIDLAKIARIYFDSVLNKDIEYIDYESFKTNRITNFETLLKYKEALSVFAPALTAFLKSFKEFDTENVLKNPDL